MIFASVILAEVTAFVASFAVVIPSAAPVESAICEKAYMLRVNDGKSAPEGEKLPDK